MKGSTVTLTRPHYEQVFNDEIGSTYPEVDYIERLCKFSVDRNWLDSTAFVLNCPVKVNPPNWQHGRIIYSVLREFLESTELEDHNMSLLDIGTAKGFSAVVMAKALLDSYCRHIPIDTVDVISPSDKVRRNTVVELNGFKTLYEIMEPFVPTGTTIRCHGGGSIPLLEKLAKEGRRIPFAFVDGKHAFDFVVREAHAIANMQKANDVVVFDDCQIPEVNRAVEGLKTYSRRYVHSGARVYVIARRR